MISIAVSRAYIDQNKTKAAEWQGRVIPAGLVRLPGWNIEKYVTACIVYYKENLKKSQRNPEKKILRKEILKKNH